VDILEIWLVEQFREGSFNEDIPRAGSWSEQTQPVLAPQKEQLAKWSGLLKPKRLLPEWM
jgi:hypothetical protein